MAMSQPLILLVTTLLVFMLSSPNYTNADPPRDIFLLAGQSNMAGRGGVHHGAWDRFVPPESQPSPDILRLNSQDSWEVAHEPLHEDIDVGKTCGVGPGMAFARGIESLGGSRFGVIGLVPCAVGGTKIIQWARGTALYGQLVRRAKVAMQEGGKIRAMLWYQGESDTARIEDAEAYKGRMQKFIGDFRSDLAHPSLFIIQVALASGEGKYVSSSAGHHFWQRKMRGRKRAPIRGRSIAPNHHVTAPPSPYLRPCFSQYVPPFTYTHTHTHTFPFPTIT